jgi:hypothetical protein
VGPRVILDAVAKRKILSPRRESNPGTPIVHPLAQRYADKYSVTSRNGTLVIQPLTLTSNLLRECMFCVKFWVVRSKELV